MKKLIKIMKKLRHPIKGCPWDLKQTPRSLKKHIIEEAHELNEAIDSQNPQKIKDEAGDMLLQIVFLSQIYRERGVFSFRDIVSALCSKLLRRHPHIFGDAKAESADDVRKLWEQIKKKEKKKKSILSDYPVSMPALREAHRISQQASSIGFDWKDSVKAFEKLEEEKDELYLEIINNSDNSKKEEELGDLLFAVVNVARLLKIDPESALKKANNKFKKRFRMMETTAEESSLVLNTLTLKELESLWRRSKELETQ